MPIVSNAQLENSRRLCKAFPTEGMASGKSVQEQKRVGDVIQGLVSAGSHHCLKCQQQEGQRGVPGSARGVHTLPGHTEQWHLRPPQLGLHKRLPSPGPAAAPGRGVWEVQAPHHPLSPEGGSGAACRWHMPQPPWRQRAKGRIILVGIVLGGHRAGKSHS